MDNRRILAILVCAIALVSLSGVAYASAGIQPGSPDKHSKPPKSGVKFYTDKTTYKYNENIEFILFNGGARTVWVPNIFTSKWEIVNLKTKEVIYIPLEDCGYSCGPDWNRLEFGGKLAQSWDQFNNNDEHVPPGTYQASATFTYSNPQAQAIQKVYTKNFKIKKP